VHESENSPAAKHPAAEKLIYWTKKVKMAKTSDSRWRLDRQISISVLIQLLLLASLIVGTWVNLQRQLDLLQHDVTLLLECQKGFEQKLELLQAKSISYEYRLRAIESKHEAAEEAKSF